tara:strand:+ start:66 stop:494 length:429 start_codon:yes stop_codon:yes gene_type:complete
VKKKNLVSSKDKEDWINYTKQMNDVSAKGYDLVTKKKYLNKVQKLDLHGLNLHKANKVVKEFILKSFNEGYKKLLIVTGKGLRSKNQNNPYISDKLSTLRYSVPEHISNDESLKKIISKISNADQKDGGEGAIYIFLKKIKE